jgi:hypothetical protein
MRGAYGVIFVGFTVMGFASVFHAHESPTQQRKDFRRADQVRLALAAAPASSTSADNDDPIEIQTEIVEPEIVEPKILRRDAPPSVAAVSHRVVRPRGSQPLPSSRSLFARVVFGDGQHRPQPFPKPASSVK